MTRTAPPDWYPGEAIYAGAEHLDPDYVAGYEQKAQYDPDKDIEALLEAPSPTLCHRAIA